MSGEFMEVSTSSISNTISKGSVDEEMSMFRASMDDAASQIADVIKPEAISNESIQNGDEILETYRVTSDAIHGGMGSVWRVHHKNWNVDLAMKRPQPKFFAEGSEKRKAEFVAECENWINLGLHPNIVSCYYVRDIGGVPSIFSEWMDGGSLEDILRDGSLYNGTEDEIQEKILDIAIQTARGLRYSHEKNMIHQDVKPGNILLSKGGDAKIADFGLAKAVSQLRDGNKALSTGYTIAYCPKEQAEGAPAEAWMDVYAWALTVLEMYAGERFWSDGASAFPKAFGDKGSQEPDYRVTPPQKLLDAWREDFYTGNGGWRSFSDYEQLLEDIYRDITGGGYYRPDPDAAENTADTLNNRALSYIDLNQPDKAEQLWKQGLAGAPDHSESVYNQGLFLWRSGLIDDVELLSRIKGTNEDKGSKDEKIRRIRTEGGALWHYSEELYDPAPKYRTDREEQEQWIQLAKQLLAAESLTCAYRDDHTDRLAVGTSEGRLFVISMDGSHKLSLVGHNEKIESVCLYEDLVFSSSRSWIKAWDAETGCCLASISGETYYYGFGHIWYDENDGLVYARHDGNEASCFVKSSKGEKAAYELNRIQSASLRLDKDRQFHNVCNQVQQLISSGMYAEALQKLQEARQIDGYSNDQRVLDLNEEAGKCCRRTGFRGVYQRISAEFSAEDYICAGFLGNGQKLVVYKKTTPEFVRYDIKTGRTLPDGTETGGDSSDTAEGKENAAWKADAVNLGKARSVQIDGKHITIKEKSSGEIIWQGNLQGNDELGNSELKDVCLLSDNRILACQRHYLRFEQDGIKEFHNLFVIDLVTGAETQIQDAVNVLYMAVISDGSFAMIFNYEHDFMLFSAEDLKLSEKMQLMPKHPEVLYEAKGYIYNAKTLRKMEFSRDGRYLLVCSVYEDTGKAVVRVFEVDWIYDTVSEPAADVSEEADLPKDNDDTDMDLAQNEGQGEKKKRGFFSRIFGRS